MASCSPVFHADGSEASKAIMAGDDVQAIILMDVEEEMISLLVSGKDDSLFEGMVPRPLEPMGAPSCYFHSIMSRHAISTMISNLKTETKVSDMVRLVNETFQCLEPSTWIY